MLQRVIKIQGEGRLLSHLSLVLEYNKADGVPALLYLYYKDTQLKKIKIMYRVIDLDEEVLGTYSSLDAAIEAASENSFAQWVEDESGNILFIKRRTRKGKAQRAPQVNNARYINVSWNPSDLLECRQACEILIRDGLGLDTLRTLNFGSLDVDSVYEEYFQKTAVKNMTTKIKNLDEVYSTLKSLAGELKVSGWNADYEGVYFNQSPTLLGWFMKNISALKAGVRDLLVASAYGDGNGYSLYEDRLLISTEKTGLGLLVVITVLWHDSDYHNDNFSTESGEKEITFLLKYEKKERNSQFL